MATMLGEALETQTEADPRCLYASAQLGGT